MSKARTIQRWLMRLFLLVLLAGAGFGVYRFRGSQAGPVFPTAAVRKGEFLVLVRCRGALRASKSAGIYTPVVPNLRIGWLAVAGEEVKEGDVIVKFDSSTAQQQVMQKEAQLRQAEATLDQANAQSKMTAQQDQTDLADARFAVERAQVQANLAAIESRIKGEQSKVDLGISAQKLKAQEATVALHEAASKSRIASLVRQRDQVKADVEITKVRIAQMDLKAPSSGLLTFNLNYSGVMSSSEARPFKIGDNTGSGMVLGQIPDLNTLEMDAKLEEADRGRVALKQDVIVRIDALPELSIPAKVSQVSALAELSTEYPYNRSFRAAAAILKPDKTLRPEMNGGMDIVINRIPNALSVPAKALFKRSGKPIVYVAEKGRYRAVEVEMLARNPDEVAITGVPEGSIVSLVDVDKEGTKK
ncbi:MAG: efflux RND transporter periplasmic adaptor subunit [Candidatus Solibacter sp.]